MRKSSIYMLLTAIALGLFAVFLARAFLTTSEKSRSSQASVATVEIVVAAAPIEFGERIAPEKLKLVQWPAGNLPDGTFKRVLDAVDEGQRVALRAIEPNELITARALSGNGGRLSTSPLFNETMRAIAIPINEVAGAAGFIVPGDRVDVFVTRSGDNEELPYTDLIVQAARVLAVGQNADAGKTEASVAKSATIEVTPLQAQRLSLAQNVGSLSVALRNLSDESRVRLETAQIRDLNDGTITRILRKPDRTAAIVAEPAATGPATAIAARPQGPTVEIFRGGKQGTTSSVYGVPK
ncbi:Flp pilus assembly protein CpaB [Polymorphobacter sp.]|uniref:Flp pilus assembly protein CpaB n=1 Tax=Polymorphobacter sp. TaxID=1909290 RepID=UPI003F6F3A7D